MKKVRTQIEKKLYTTLAIVSVVLFSFKQNKSSDNECPIEVSVKGINESISIKTTEECLYKILGKADSVLSEENEFDGSKYLLNYYGNSSFLIENGMVVGFNITDKRFLMNQNIKIGMKKSHLRKALHSCFQRIEEFESRFRVKIKNTDSYLIFEFEEDRLLKFYTWDDL